MDVVPGRESRRLWGDDDELPVFSLEKEVIGSSAEFIFFTDG